MTRFDWIQSLTPGRRRQCSSLESFCSWHFIPLLIDSFVNNVGIRYSWIEDEEENLFPVSTNSKFLLMLSAKQVDSAHELIVIVDRSRNARREFSQTAWTWLRFVSVIWGRRRDRIVVSSTWWTEDTNVTIALSTHLKARSLYPPLPRLTASTSCQFRKAECSGNLCSAWGYRSGGSCNREGIVTDKCQPWPVPRSGYYYLSICRRWSLATSLWGRLVRSNKKLRRKREWHATAQEKTTKLWIKI